MAHDGRAARLEDVVKTYRTPSGEVRALGGITADFPRAAVTAVVGPSGSGKSSLLRLLAGMERPDAGVVEVGGVELQRASARTSRGLRRNAIGYVFQRPSDNLFSYLTVREHLELASRSSASTVGFEALLDDLGIAHRIDHLPSALSGGEQQRAAFAQVVAMARSGVVVADEPTAEIDSASARSLLEKVGSLVETGVTFVIATHDANVIDVADNVVELEHGVIKGDASVEPSLGRERRRPTDTSLYARQRSGTYLPHARRAAPPLRYGRRVKTWSRDAYTEGSKRADVVSVVGISKSYARGAEVVHALQDASVTVHEGEVVGLVGRSGSGKTTLLNVIAGWEQPDGGLVSWPQRDGPGGVVPWSDIGVLPQKFGLIEELTVRQNVEYPARLAGCLDDSRGAIDELIEGLRLGALELRYPTETSVGEQQRTALARALVLSPRLVLADEPTAHQDRESTEAIFDVVRRAGARGTSCLVATHNDEVLGYLDRVLAMSDGRVTERSRSGT